MSFRDWEYLQNDFQRMKTFKKSIRGRRSSRGVSTEKYLPKRFQKHETLKCLSDIKYLRMGLSSKSRLSKGFSSTQRTINRPFRDKKTSKEVLRPKRGFKYKGLSQNVYHGRRSSNEFSKHGRLSKWLSENEDIRIVFPRPSNGTFQQQSTIKRGFKDKGLSKRL